MIMSLNPVALQLRHVFYTCKSVYFVNEYSLDHIKIYMYTSYCIRGLISMDE